MTELTPISDHSSNETLPSGDLCEGDVFCRAVFENLHIAVGGEAKPCCEFTHAMGNVKENSIGEIWQSESIGALRARILRGERDQGCSKCYAVEDAGGSSLRDEYNARGPVIAYPDTSVRSLTPVTPAHLDIRFSNLCNLSCRTCGPELSTKWHAEGKILNWWKLGPNALIDTFGSKSNALEALGPSLETVESVYFAGGEPLLHEGHYAVLQELINRGRTDVALSYNSNLTELGLGKLEIIPLWSRFKSVLVQASIDGYGERGELVRKGLSWDKFAANVRTVRRECPHVNLRFQITVSVFNILSLPELSQSLMDIDPGDTQFHYNVLHDPIHFNTQILPPDLKEEAKRKIEAFADQHGLRDDLDPVVSYMMFQDHPKQLSTFRRNVFALDKLRHESTADTLPELKPILREPAIERYKREAKMSLDSLVRSVRKVV